MASPRWTEFARSVKRAHRSGPDQYFDSLLSEGAAGRLRLFHLLFTPFGTRFDLSGILGFRGRDEAGLAASQGCSLRVIAPHGETKVLTDEGGAPGC
jgi:hypothetical protein